MLVGDPHSNVCTNPILISNYRKTNLFVDDKVWASPSPVGFQPPVELTFRKSGSEIKVGCFQAICADIDPADWSNEDSVFELAENAVKHQLKVEEEGGRLKGYLILFSTIWLFSKDTKIESEEKCTRDTLEYWQKRLTPIKNYQTISDMNRSSFIIEKPTFFFAAGECGVENGVDYYGTSSVIKIHQGETMVLKHLGMRETNILTERLYFDCS